jgi:hypothetical protein
MRCGKRKCPCITRIAVAQISFNAAYVDTAGMSDLHEPIPDDQWHGLYRAREAQAATINNSDNQGEGFGAS